MCGNSAVLNQSRTMSSRRAWPVVTEAVSTTISMLPLLATRSITTLPPVFWNMPRVVVKPPACVTVKLGTVWLGSTT